MAREGPSWDPAGYLYFVGNNKVSRMDSQGKVEAFKDPSPGANGSLVDPQKRVIVCESQSRRVIRIERDGSVTVLADNYEGKKFNSPNDVSIDSKGRIYFTDPRYGRRDTMEILDAQGKQVEGVYRIDAPGKVTRIIEHEVERPNGILVSPVTAICSSPTTITTPRAAPGRSGVLTSRRMAPSTPRAVS